MHFANDDLMTSRALRVSENLKGKDYLESSLSADDLRTFER